MIKSSYGAAVLSSYMTMTIRVCGEEPLTLTDSSEFLLIWGVTSGYHYINQADFRGFFTLPPNDPCQIDAYSIHKSNGDPWTDS
jgi:hypothetical protein